MSDFYRNPADDLMETRLDKPRKFFCRPDADSILLSSRIKIHRDGNACTIHPKPWAEAGFCLQVEDCESRIPNLLIETSPNMK